MDSNSNSNENENENDSENESENDKGNEKGIFKTGCVGVHQLKCSAQSCCAKLSTP